MGSILRSIYADYRSLLFDKPPSQSFLGLRNALLKEETREEALRTTLWTTFCLASSMKEDIVIISQQNFI